MQRLITCGIDIGTYHIKVVATESYPDNNLPPRIIGTGFAESKGLRHGYIMNIEEASRSIQAAVRSAEKTAGVKLPNALVSVGGVGLSAHVFQGSCVIENEEHEITDTDIEKVLAETRSQIPQSFSQNRRILHTIPLAYKVDGRVVLGRPHGMKGSKIEARILFVVCLSHHLNDVLLAVDDAGIQVDDVVASPIAASSVMLTRTQKAQGCVLANIGSETTSIIVYEDGRPISLEVFPIGSSNITNDIALGLRIPLEDAEQVKLGNLQKIHTREGDVHENGNKNHHNESKKDRDHREKEQTKERDTRRRLDDIIKARLIDMFELIENHLEKIGRNGLLPAGIIITGGGGALSSIEDVARASLELPSRRADHKFETNTKGYIKSAEWAVAYGLCVLGNSEEESESLGTGRIPKSGLKTALDNIKKWVKQFLP